MILGVQASALRRVRTQLLVCGTMLAGACLDEPVGPPSSRPNIILVVVDDLRWDALASTGNPYTKTPNLDEIAQEGAVFRNAFVVNSLCSPSRATIVTGLYPDIVGVLDNDTPLPSHFKTIGQFLHGNGYATAFIGKWHMGNSGATPQPGFDEWVGFPGQGVYFNPILSVNGKSVQTQGYITDILTDYAERFIDQSKGRPFFLMLSHKADHQPWTPRADEEELYARTSLQPPVTFDENLSTKPAPVQAWAKYLNIAGDTSKLFPTLRAYYDVLAGVDESVGRIIRELQELGIADNTLIIVTSDNGYLWGEHGLLDKRFAYDESIRIPMLVRYPRWFSPGSSFSALALNLDLAPTILDAAGITIPRYMQGVSLRSLATGATKRSAFFYEYYADPTLPIIPSLYALRTERALYVHYADGEEELYDLQADPLETANLVNDSVYADSLTALRAEATAYGVAVGYRGF